MEELHPPPTPFPVKTQSKKPKPTRKISQVPMHTSKVSHLQRPRRVFGTTRNQNIPMISNPKPAISEKLPKPKPAKLTTSSHVPDKKSSEPSQKTPPPQMKKIPKQRKSVSFQGIEGEGSEKRLEFHPTPIKSPSLLAKRWSGSSTPYLSAGTCSKNCRYDRLETSAYWIGQIKLAETVGKHFVSSSFFRLAFECKAENFGNIRVELNKYLTRHEYLNEEEEWKRLSIIYGLVKEKNDGDDINAKANARNDCYDERQEVVQKEVAEENQLKLD